MSEPFLGQISMVGFTFPPRGWAQCDGQLLSIASYSALFSILGTTYGGDGRTNFALPDLRGRLAMHPGNGPGLSTRSLGGRYGDLTVPLTAAQNPPHSVAVEATTDAAYSTDPAGLVPALSADVAYNDATPETAMHSEVVSAGSGQSHDNMQPYGVINYIIALTGVFPS